MSAPVGRMAALVAAQRRAQASRLRLAAAAGAVVSAAATALLGLSGWFIVGAALAGAAGPAVAQMFNYLVPSAIIRLLAILRTGARYVERVASHDAALHALARLRPQVFGAFVRGRPDDLLKVAAGEASSRLVRDIDAVQSLFVRLSNPWSLGAAAATSAILAFLAHPLAGLTVLVAMAATALAGRALADRLAAPAGAQVQDAGGRFKARLSALEAAAPELKAYDLSQWAIEDVSVVAAELDHATVKLHQASAWIAASQAIITGLAVAGVIVAAAGAAAPLVALAALAAVSGIEAVAGLTAAFRQDGQTRAAVRRLDELLPPPVSARGRSPRDHGIVLRATGDVVFPADRLALTGPSGAGKTTLVERLVGLRAPLSNEWLVGAEDASDLAAGTARKLFAYAAQDVRLLDGSVRENLKLAAPAAGDADLWRVLEDVALADRVRAAPEGLNLNIGANGCRLSGGERRRLALARALLRDAPWLVLDEPTEGLDAETERCVLAALDRRLSERGQGLLLISHRPAPLRLCRRAVRVEGVGTDGRVSLRAAAKPAGVRAI